MSGKCGACGSDTERDNGYTVCTSCGACDDSTQLQDDAIQMLNTNDKPLFSGQTVGACIRNELMKDRETQVRRMAMKFTETLASNFNFNREMKNDLIMHFKQAMEHRVFFHSNFKNKCTLAAVCAYHCLVNYGECVTIQHICNASDCDCFEFGQIRTKYLAAFPESKPIAKSIEEMIPVMLNDFDIDKSEMNKLNTRVVDIISVVRECWLVDGRSPVHLINAATYLGWKSLKPSERCKLKPLEVFEILRIQSNLTTTDRVKELTDALIKLAHLIPSVKSSQMQLNKNNIAIYIDDILRFSNSLIYDLKFNVHKTVCSHNDDDYEFMNSFKRRVNYDKQNSKQEKSEKVVNEECDDCDLDDIDDEELNCYLRSENEIKMIKKLRKLAKMQK